jgi:hypothetical protein
MNSESLIWRAGRGTESRAQSASDSALTIGIGADQFSHVADGLGLNPAALGGQGSALGLEGWMPPVEVGDLAGDHLDPGGKRRVPRLKPGYSRAALPTWAAASWAHTTDRGVRTGQVHRGCITFFRTYSPNLRPISVPTRVENR